MTQTSILRLAHLYITLAIIFIPQCCTSYLPTQYSHLATNRSPTLTMYVKNMSPFASKELAENNTSPNAGRLQEPRTNLQNPARSPLETHQQEPHKSEERHRNGQPSSRHKSPKPKVSSLPFNQKYLPLCNPGMIEPGSSISPAPKLNITVLVPFNPNNVSTKADNTDRATPNSNTNPAPEPKSTDSTPTSPKDEICMRA